MIMVGANTLKKGAMPVGRGRKRKVKPVTVASNPWDAGPAMAERLIVEPVGEVVLDLDGGNHKFQPIAGGLKRARREAWIDIYHRKGKLTDRQHVIAVAVAKAAAGQPCLDPLGVLRVDGPRGGDFQAAKVDARRAYFAMLRMVPESCRPMIVHLVVSDLPLPSIGGRTAELFLKKVCIGLNALADFFDKG